MPITAARAEPSSAAAWSSGISRTHGSHQVAKKLSTHRPPAPLVEAALATAQVRQTDPGQGAADTRHAMRGASTPVRVASTRDPTQKPAPAPIRAQATIAAVVRADISGRPLESAVKRSAASNRRA
jgi:hypothetical protein